MVPGQLNSGPCFAALLTITAAIRHVVVSETVFLGLGQALQHDPALAGRKALFVDDDIRNIFALTSVLEQHDVEVFYAENGRDGLQMLQEIEGIDVVLMDVMMPIMDGYEATTRIRKKAAYKDLPIISLTAKAMPEDKAKSLEAGANDYLTKPVNIGKLLDMIWLWLYQ